jgi:hypothetical protein
VTKFEPLITRDTVALETPAILAISRMLMDKSHPKGEQIFLIVSFPGRNTKWLLG